MSPVQTGDSEPPVPGELLAGLYDNPGYREFKEAIGRVPKHRPRRPDPDQQMPIVDDQRYIVCLGTSERPHEARRLSPALHVLASGEILWLPPTDRRVRPVQIDYWYSDGRHEFRFACNVCGLRRSVSEKQLLGTLISHDAKVVLSSLPG